LARQIRGALPGGGGAGPASVDISAQLQNLIRPGFLSATPSAWRVHLPRYLQAALARCGKLEHPKDGSHQAQVDVAWSRYREWRDSLPPGWPEPDAIARYRWLVEEFRVSLFAQSLGTSVPVSGKRLEEAWRAAVSLV
jgi:ATP-dependent helicase HrpA